MALRPWIVSLISTDYDLKDERKAVIDFLRNNGIEVSAYEEPDYPVNEETYSHDNCIKALKRADMAILLIKQRYGGPFFMSPDISITQAEYYKLEIPTIVLVNRRTWDERDSYRRQQKKSGLSEEDFAKSGAYDSGKIDIKEIQFIDEIQRVYQTSGKSNWINFWEDVEELTKILPDVMKSRSVTLIHRLLEEQKREVNNRRTSTGLSMPLGDVFSRGFYIEPEYEKLSGNVDDTSSLTEGINKKLAENESCLVLGEAGAGKTTLMAKCFLHMADSSKDDPFFIPVYVWLKSMNPDNSFSVEEYLRKGCEQYLQREYYPFFNLNDFRFVFYLDGFDELAEKLSKEELHKLYSSEIFKWPLMLTSRLQYADRYLNSNEFVSKFGCCIKLTDWTTDTATKYISQFCDLQKKDGNFKQRIMALLVENNDLHDVLKSPLLITILLYVIERNRMEIPETIRSRTQLFEECFEKLAQREIETKIKVKEPIPNNQDLVTQWAFFAWMIYENRLMGEKSIRISDAISRIKSFFTSPIIEWPSVVYEVVFDIHGEYAYGALHEQFMEFLVAHTLAYACLNKTEPYPEFLRYVMRPEINRYFRGIVIRKPEQEQRIIFDHIKELYWNCVGSTTNDDILKRVHAVYHLSRLTSKNASTEIGRIFNSETELAVRQSLYFGVIKKGDLKRENELYNLLNTDNDYSNSNRGYHLAYYDSVPSQISLPYTDDPTVGWDGSLRAFQRHFSSLDTEHYYLWRVDLITMRQFMEYRRKREPLTDNILEQIGSCIAAGSRDANPEYKSLVEEEFQRVKEVYEKLD